MEYEPSRFFLQPPILVSGLAKTLTMEKENKTAIMMTTLICNLLLPESRTMFDHGKRRDW